MLEHDAVQVFKCLADATRLKILRSLHEEPKYVELLSERLDRTPPTISFHLKKLEEAGLVTSKKEQYYTIYSLKKDVFEMSIENMILQNDEPTDEQAIREKAYRQKVLDNFYEYGKLKSIPVQRKKKRIVLEKIAEGFVKGTRYPEKEVNLIIAETHDDFCTLRRELIVEGIMERDHGEYWLSENGVIS